MQTKLQLAVKSAARALLPIVVLMAGLYASGKLQDWHDVYSPETVGIILAALGIKGISTLATAKDVTVKENLKE